MNLLKKCSNVPPLGKMLQHTSVGLAIEKSLHCMGCNFLPEGTLLQLFRVRAYTANDMEEEHLLADRPEDEEGDEDEDAAAVHSATEAPEPQQHLVGTVSEAPVEDTTTNAGRKQAALQQITALQDQVVFISTG
jgi:hypothetical protein